MALGACFLIGCSASAFYVRVSDPAHRGIARASVSVFFDDDVDACKVSRAAAQLTDDVGRTLIQLRFCDDVLFTVVASGYQMHRVVIDACEEKDQAVILQPLPPEPRDDAAVLAREFFLAVRSGEIEQVESMVADDVPAEHFLNLGYDMYYNDCDVNVLRVRANGSVDLALGCEDSCYTTWTVQLTKQADGWKVRDLSPLAGG